MKQTIRKVVSPLIETLNFEADYGSLSVEEASAINGEADYLTIKIGSVNNSLDLNMGLWEHSRRED